MIIVLRLGHRLARDARISTHCGLVSRALGADKIIFAGEKDQHLLDNIQKTAERWGGKFSVEYSENPKSTIKNYKKKDFLVVHLTMYGIPVQKQIEKIRKSKNILIIIGSEKVPIEIYQMSDFNIAVTNQPHSEVAALSIFLHEYFKAKQLNKKFSNAKIKITPQKAGKKIQENKTS